MDNLDEIVGPIVGQESGIEYRQVLGHAEENERWSTPDGRNWIAVREVLQGNTPFRDPSGFILRSPFTIHWKSEQVNLYGIPLPLEPFTATQWDAIGGARIESLAGPRLQALGNYLFTSNPDAPAPNRTLGQLVTDCTEPLLSDYLVAIRNPNCFRPENAAPLVSYRDGWTVFAASEHFVYYTRLGAIALDDPGRVQTAMEEAWDKYKLWALREPMPTPGFAKIPVLLDDWGRIRGDTTPLGPIRLNSRILNSADGTLLLVQALCAHELFHRVQYSYGFRRLDVNDLNSLPFVEQRPFLYFSEGTASACEAIAFDTSTADSKLQSLRMHPEMGLLDTAYAAMGFWLQYAGNSQILTQFMTHYREARIAGQREEAIRFALGQSAFNSVVKDDLLLALRNPYKLQSPDAGIDANNPQDVKAGLRVTPLNPPSGPVTGALGSYGTDVFLVPSQLPVEAHTSGAGISATVEKIGNDNLILVSATETAGPYTMVLGPGPAPPPQPVPAVSTILIPPSPELSALGISVALDQLGNVLLHSESFTDVALGFQVHIPIGTLYGRVWTSISGWAPENPGWGNRDFDAGGFSGQHVSLQARGGPLPLGAQLDTVTRDVTISGTDVKVKTTLNFTQGQADVQFGYSSLSRTAPAVRDSDDGLPPACDRGNDCDPDTRPAVLWGDPPPGATAERQIYLSPGYIVAPYSFQVDTANSSIEFKLTYSCEEFMPLFPLCP